MRKALEGPNSRKKTKQQTKQQGPHWGARRDSADGPRESREQKRERRQRPPRRARCAPASATQRCSASVPGCVGPARRVGTLRCRSAVRAWRRDACVRRPRIPRLSFPGSSAADATRASASLSHPVVRAADCTARATAARASTLEHRPPRRASSPRTACRGSAVASEWTLGEGLLRPSVVLFAG